MGLSKKFTHTCQSAATITVFGYNYLNAKENIDVVYQEASNYFFQDLKEMLELTGLPVAFSENVTYNASGECPHFEIFGIQIPFAVRLTNSKAANYGVTPCFYRTGEYSVASSFKYTSKNNMSISGNTLASMVRSATDNLNLEYTINIEYNDNFIIATYTTIGGLKFPMFCLIKGYDINGKQVVYYSASMNSASTGSQSDTNSIMYHRLCWAENWNFNPYNGNYRTPNADVGYPAKVNVTSDDYLFVNLQDIDAASGVQSLDSRIQLMQPICCNNKVFFDNLYVVPKTVNIDTFYTINNDLYYCPGDYLAKINLENNAANAATYGLRFILKVKPV